MYTRRLQWIDDSNPKPPLTKEHRRHVQIEYFRARRWKQKKQGQKARARIQNLLALQYKPPTSDHENDSALRNSQASGSLDDDDDDDPLNSNNTTARTTCDTVESPCNCDCKNATRAISRTEKVSPLVDLSNTRLNSHGRHPREQPLPSPLDFLTASKKEPFSAYPLPLDAEDENLITSCKLNEQLSG